MSGMHSPSPSDSPRQSGRAGSRPETGRPPLSLGADYQNASPAPPPPLPHAPSGAFRAVHAFDMDDPANERADTRLEPSASEVVKPAAESLPPTPMGIGTMRSARRLSKVIIGDDPGGISLRRVSIPASRGASFRCSTATPDHATDDGRARAASITLPDGAPLPQLAITTSFSEKAQRHSNQLTPNGGGGGAPSSARYSAPDDEEATALTPSNPHILPSLGEKAYPLRKGNASRSFVFVQKGDLRINTAETPKSGGSGAAMQHAFGEDAMSEDGGGGGDGLGDDGEIAENTFAFIPMESDRLERERVIALIDSSYLTWRHRWFCILEGRPHDQDERITIIFNLTSIFFVLGSCIIFCLQSLPSNTKRSDLELHHDPLFWSETACIIFFVFEAVWRIVCVPLSHLFTAFFAVDLVTIVGYFADLLMSANALSAVAQALRLLRVLRIFKLSRYSTSLQLVFSVLRNSFSGLSMLVMPLTLAAIVGAAGVYVAEVWDATFDRQYRVWIRPSGFPSEIQSIPDGLWFVMTTITTVGYGDVVPETIAGKILAVVLMFFGVLTLSFPNIVLGANLQVAFRQSKQNQGVSYFTKRMRKIVHVVAFIRRTQYWVAVRKAREAACAHRTAYPVEKQFDIAGSATLAAISSAGSGENTNGSALLQIDSSAALQDSSRPALHIRANYCFFPTAADFEAHRKPGIDLVRPANLRYWNLRGVDAVSLLQVTLEVFSGVATADEIYSELMAIGLMRETRLKDVALTLLYLAEARVMRVFILQRNTTHIVAALMEPAITELLLHAERGTRTCRRSAEYARFVWKQTTGQLVPYTLSLLFNSYTTWSRRERYAEDDTPADLRDTIDLPEDVRKVLFDETEMEDSGFAASLRAASRPGGLNSTARTTSIIARSTTRRMAGSHNTNPLGAFGRSSPTTTGGAGAVDGSSSGAFAPDVTDGIRALHASITSAQAHRKQLLNELRLADFAAA